MKFQLGIIGTLILNGAFALAADGGETTDSYRELQSWKLINAVCIGTDENGTSTQTSPIATSGEVLKLQNDEEGMINTAVIKAEDLDATKLRSGSKIIVIDPDKAKKEIPDVTVVHRNEGPNSRPSFYVLKTIKQGQVVTGDVGSFATDTTEYNPVCKIGSTLLLSFQNVSVDHYKDPKDKVKKSDKSAKKKKVKKRTRHPKK